MNLKKYYFYLKFGLARDVGNIVKYGFPAPRFAEKIIVDPKKIEFIATPNYSSSDIRFRSGSVIGDEEWQNFKLVSLMTNPKFIYCQKHWVENKTWEESGAIDYLCEQIEKRGKIDNCSNKENVIERYNQLDHVFDLIKKDERIKSRRDICRKNFREWQGILVHIGPNGKPFFGGGGFHRLAIAKILDLKFPAQLGLVHFSSIQTLRRFRH